MAVPDTLHHWTAEQLAELPVKGDFRLRGLEMTRLETFTDAAFAFAVTLLVISVDDVPGSYEEFMEALKQIPAFVGCFLQLMLFWWGHHSWSRRYGLEDGLSMVVSLTLVAAVLVYIYPLRVIFGAFFANASGGLLSPPFDLVVEEIGVLFVVFGAGFSALAALLAILYLIAYTRREPLGLNRLEIFHTRSDVLVWSVVAATGLVSMSAALLLPDELSAAAGFVYWSLAISMPAFGFWVRRMRDRIE
ncbi:MAG: TMEM175 family protein [Pseudomonadales bacterium]|nr:DUF1211 domain-containing protein [Pseudomonadales bacterium]